jgi:hypothetical protein
MHNRVHQKAQGIDQDMALLIPARDNLDSRGILKLPDLRFDMRIEDSHIGAVGWARQ